ncbi:MAG TPA: response regulator [Terriglobales bacterium]|nr:response regulator [Terriglobales bacterium]
MPTLLKRILFVDDEPAIRATLSAILRRYGFLVTVAATVQEALEAIQGRQFDLLLTDLNIEREGDGYEVIRAIRNVNPRCVTIVLTGHPDVESAVEGIHLGIDDYILKPAKADTLVALLAEKLAARQPRGRILLVWDDEPALRTWTMLLESRGYQVLPALQNFSLEARRNDPFDVLLVAASIPAAERRNLIEKFRRFSKAPVVVVRNAADQDAGNDADSQIDADPELVLKTLAQISGGATGSRTGAEKPIAGSTSASN